MSETAINIVVIGGVIGVLAIIFRLCDVSPWNGAIKFLREFRSLAKLEWNLESINAIFSLAIIFTIVLYFVSGNFQSIIDLSGADVAPKKSPAYFLGSLLIAAVFAGLCVRSIRK
jgi:hypothetical protein